jgi:hypothetical protein
LLKEVPEPHKTRKKRDLFFKKKQVPNSGGWITSQAEKTHHNRSTHHPQL